MEKNINNNVIDEENNDIVKWGEIKDTIKRDKSEEIYRRHGRLSMSEKRQLSQQDQQIIEIVRYLACHLAKNHNSIVYGYWFCRRWKCQHKPQCSSRQGCERKGVCQHEPQCQYEIECQNKLNCELDEQKCKHEPPCGNKVQNRRKWQNVNKCKYKWRFLYTQESLEMYLKRFLYTQGPLEMYLRAPERPTEFFMHHCDECDENALISSFLLYPPENSNKKLVEIICHLEWHNHYRVFGNWKCLHCKNRWSSAYTWISLQKFIEQKFTNKGDFFMQGCNKCRHDNCTISNYKPLELSEGTDHKRDLCAKCQHGEFCHEIDTYYGQK